LNVSWLEVLFKDVNVVCVAQIRQHPRERSDPGFIAEVSLSPVSAEANMIVKLERPRDFFE
jgi:hypothetical protein